MHVILGVGDMQATRSSGVPLPSFSGALTPGRTTVHVQPQLPNSIAQGFTALLLSSFTLCGQLLAILQRSALVSCSFAGFFLIH